MTNILTACLLGLLAGLPLTAGTALAQTSSIVWKEIGDLGAGEGLTGQVVLSANATGGAC